MQRTIRAFSMFNAEVPNSALYLHCLKHDAGGNLVEYIDTNFPKEIRDRVYFPAMNSYTDMPGPEIVNLIYNSADCMVSTSLAEGWGMQLTETMACKKIGCFPFNTSMQEIITKSDGAVPVASGSSISMLTQTQLDDQAIERPLTDTEDHKEDVMGIQQ
jgi:glycosyltransferase involved in cell wall biosynthesis